MSGQAVEGDQRVLAVLLDHEAEPCGEYRPNFRAEWWFCPACGWESERTPYRDPGGVAIHPGGRACRGGANRSARSDRRRCVMSLFGINTCDACTSCAECSYTWCRDEEVSPGEDRGLCATCALMAERLSGWGA